MAQVATDLDPIDPVQTRPVLIAGEPQFHDITETVARPVEWRPPRGWYIAFAISCSMLVLFVFSIAWLFWQGIGIWGNQVPVGWAFDITNFVFWVGIAHAGTFISAILYLFRQRWRTAINRTAEAMTIFAVMCALMFPAIHVGRPWVIYWTLPIPNQMGTWPQFRSPLMWDVFAVSIYGTVSALFWFLGLIPDLATLRDRARGKVRQIVYGLLALGWNGSQRQWLHHEKAYLLLAGLATPLVLSVHSVVSFDFAVSQIPGWHATIFPPYFVAGAIFSGMALVVTLMVICRTAFRMEQLITLVHFDRMAKVILLTGSMVAYTYLVEIFIAWFSGNTYERFVLLNRALGPYAWAYWIMVACNVLSPQVFWFKRARTSMPVLFVVSILVNVGMWFERFVIIVTSLHRDFLPSAWSYYSPTVWDFTTLIGSFGLFFTLFCLFVRYVPMVAMAEVKGIIPAAQSPKLAGTGVNPPVQSLHAVPQEDVRKVRGETFGLLARFETVEKLKEAAGQIRQADYTCWDAHSPILVHDLTRVVEPKASKIPRLVLAMGLGGAAVGMLLQWWVSTLGSPLVISGKPLFSWPAFVPIMFECGVLGGALGAILGFLISARLPKLYHPLFQSRAFEGVTDDRFFISIESRDPLYDLKRTTEYLTETGAVEVESV